MALNVSTSTISEKEMVEISRKILSEKLSHVFLEVALFSSSVDMIALNDENVIAIEFKLRDWKKALSQVRKHAICVDYMYICMPKLKRDATRKNVENTLRDYGVGLLYFVIDDKGQPSIEESVAPVKSWPIWKKKRDDLVNYLLSI